MALYDGVDMARVMYGQNAVHVPAFFYVQNQGDGMVSFIGGSALPGAVHPLRYGSERAHQLVIGEVIVRPHIIVATDTLQGLGMNGMMTTHHDLTAMLAKGEMVLGTEDQARTAGAGWL